MQNICEHADHSRTTFSGRRQTKGEQRSGALYYVSYGDGGPIKIGFCESFGGLSERLRGLQTGCPFDLILLAVKAGSVADERNLHVRFKARRMRGEWFSRHQSLLRHIEGVKRRGDCRSWLARLDRYTGQMSPGIVPKSVPEAFSVASPNGEAV